MNLCVRVHDNNGQPRRLAAVFEEAARRAESVWTGCRSGSLDRLQPALAASLNRVTQTTDTTDVHTRCTVCHLDGGHNLQTNAGGRARCTAITEHERM